MGILKKTLSSKSDRSAVTIIAAGNRFTGNVVATGRVHIDGIFEGEILSNCDVSIGKQGVVVGNVKAPNLNVSGRLEGEVSCNELHIEDGGDVRATVTSNKMSIDGSGMFVGERRTIETVICAAATPSINDPIGLIEGGNVEQDILASLPDKITLGSENDE